MTRYLLLLSCFVIMCCTPQQEWQNKPIVVFTFDDCHLSIYEEAFPLLEEFGYCGSNIVCSGWPDNAGFYNWAQLAEMSAAGWDVISHTVNHVRLSEVAYEIAEAEILLDIENFLQRGIEPAGFALPAGAVNQKVYELLCRHFDCIRNSEDSENYYPVDRKAIGYFAMQSSYGVSKPVTRLQLAEYRGECMVVLGFHRLSEEAGNYTGNCQPEVFRGLLEYIADQGFEVLSLGEAVKRCSF